MAAFVDKRQDDLRRALGHLEGISIRALDRGLGPLVHGIERREMGDLIGLQRLLVLQAAEDREIDRVVVRRLRRQCAGEDEVAAVMASRQNGSPSVSLF